MYTLYDECQLYEYILLDFPQYLGRENVYRDLRSLKS